jgi:hypothetical protein
VTTDFAAEVSPLDAAIDRFMLEAFDEADRW